MSSQFSSRWDQLNILHYYTVFQIVVIYILKFFLGIFSLEMASPLLEKFFILLRPVFSLEASTCYAYCNGCTWNVGSSRNKLGICLCSVYDAKKTKMCASLKIQTHAPSHTIYLIFAHWQLVISFPLISVMAEKTWLETIKWHPLFICQWHILYSYHSWKQGSLAWASLAYIQLICETEKKYNRE